MELSNTPTEFCVVVGFISVLIIWVMLPLVPSIIIYRKFPSNPLIVRGILAGLTVNTGSAFGAYLLIFALISPVIMSARDTIKGFLHPTWIITGKINLIDAKGEKMESGELIEKIKVRTTPPVQLIDGSDFRIVVATESNKIPKISFNIPGFGDGISSNDNKDIEEFSEFHRTIKLSKPVEIRQRPLKASASGPIGIAPDHN